MSKPSATPQLHVVARAPFEVYFEGEASALSASNKVGPFDILPGHADFFSMLTACEVIVQTEGEPVTFQVRDGIITVRDDNVLLFANM